MINVKRFRRRRPPEEGIPRIVPCGELSKIRRSALDLINLDDDEDDHKNSGKQRSLAARGDAPALQNYRLSEDFPSNECQQPGKKEAATVRRVLIQSQRAIPDTNAKSVSGFWTELAGEDGPTKRPRPHVAIASEAQISPASGVQQSATTGSPTVYKSSLFRSRMGQEPGK